MYATIEACLPSIWSPTIPSICILSTHSRTAKSLPRHDFSFKVLVEKFDHQTMKMLHFVGYCRSWCNLRYVLLAEQNILLLCPVFSFRCTVHRFRVRTIIQLQSA